MCNVVVPDPDIWWSSNPRFPINTEREGEKERENRQETTFILNASLAINVCDFTKEIKHIESHTPIICLLDCKL